MKIIAIMGSLFFGVSVFSSEHTMCQDTSLMAAFKSSQCAKKLIIHHFAFAEENKSFFDQVFKKQNKIVDMDMLACSQDDLSLMRRLQRSHIDIDDFIVSSSQIWQLEGENWIRFPLTYAHIEVAEAKKNSYCQPIVVYNIADDSILSNGFHIVRIRHLLQQNASLIVNVSKNKWDKVFEESFNNFATNAFPAQEVEFFGEKPVAPKSFIGLWVVGGVSLAAIVGLLCYKLIFIKN